MGRRALYREQGLGIVTGEHDYGRNASVVYFTASSIHASELGLHAEGSATFLRLAPTYAIFPGTTIALALLSCNLMEASLRNLLTPRRKGNGEVFGGDRERRDLEPTSR